MKHISDPHWLVKSIGSAAFTPVLLLSFLGFTLWSLRSVGAGAESQPYSSGFLTLLAVALGCLALSWVRPQRAGLSPPHVMLSLGFGGMFLGLLFDVLNAGPERLQDLCSQSTALGFFDSLALHLEFLPGMHVGMLAGGLLAIPSLRLLRSHCGRYLCSLFAQNLMCSTWMMVGMTLGAVWLSRWQVVGSASTLTGMLGGMFVGMTWGMVVSVALYRGFFLVRHRAQKTS
jgi:hypothetical protein